MSRKLVLASLVLALAACAAASAYASVPDPANSSVSWGGPFNGICTFPVLCPRGTGTDPVATINLTVKDQFNIPMNGIGANEIEATGSCLLLGGSPCSQVISVAATGPTNGSGQTTILLSKAGGCCSDLQIRARGVTLNTLTYRSVDLNADGSVTLGDLGILAITFGLSLGNPNYNACVDYNCDNSITLGDLGIFALHYGHACV